jgi:hypothetical protein
MLHKTLLVTARAVISRLVRMYISPSWHNARISAQTPLVLNLGTRWRRVVNFTPRQLYPRKRTPVPIEQEAWGGFQSRSVRFGEKNLSPLPEIKPQFLELKSPELVTVPTTLSRYCSSGRKQFLHPIWGDSNCTKTAPLPSNVFQLHQLDVQISSVT